MVRKLESLTLKICGPEKKNKKKSRPDFGQLSSNTSNNLGMEKYIVSYFGGPPLKFGAQKQNFGTRFWENTLTVNNFEMKQDVVNRKSALKTTDTPLGDSLILFTFVY